MDIKVINQKNHTLLNINKIKEDFENNHIFNIMPGIKENNDNDLNLSIIKNQTDKKEGKKIFTHKGKVSLFRNSMLNIKITNKSNYNPLDILLKEEESLKNIQNNDSTSIENDFQIEKKSIKPINLKNFPKNFSKRKFSNRFSLSKKKPIIYDNEIIKEEEMPANYNKIFSTEIYSDNTSTNKNNKTDININTKNNFQNKKNSKNDLNTSNNNSRIYNKKNENPLLIPEEDMIFEEMKKYKCFKYFTKDELDKTGVPFIYIKMNMNPNKDSISTTDKNNSLDKSLNDTKFLQKLLKTGKDKVFLSKGHKKGITDERKKEILEKVYRIKTAPDFYKRIKIIKTKKDKKKLKNYQNNFLKIVKYNISNKYYESLKDKFSEIREVAEGNYNTNYKFIKEIEKSEENVINNINQICYRYKRYFATKNINKLFIKSIGPRLKLPKINFVQIVKKDFLSQNIKSKKKLSKRNLINLKKNIINKNNQLNKDNMQISQNKDIIFNSTNYNKFKSHSTNKI